MISLLTRAMISSMVFPAFGSTGCVAAAPFSFGAGGGGTGFAAVAAGGAWELDSGFSWDCAGACPLADNAANGSAAQTTAKTASFRIKNLTLKSLALPLKAEQYVSQDHRNRLPSLQFNPQYAARIRFNPRPRAHHAHQPGRIERCFRVKAHRNAAALALDRGNPQALAHRFEDGIVQKVFHGARRSPESVFQLLADVLLFLFGRDRRNPLIRPQPQVFAGNIILRNPHI